MRKTDPPAPGRSGADGPDGNGTADASAKPAPGGGWETLRTIVSALFIALLIRSFLFQPFNIPSSSMLPTLLVGDYLFVSKYAYGYSRYAFPFSPPLFNGRVFSSVPERGAVIVFRHPRDPRADFVKRVIGLPGDRVQVVDGAVRVNAVPVPRELVGAYTEHLGRGGTRITRRYRETPAGSLGYDVLDAIAGGRGDNTGIYEVPPGHLFVMGDNRDNSTDSRRAPEHGGIGYVPLENVVGRAELVMFSLAGGARFWEVWKWPRAVRWGRMFTAVENGA